MCVCMHVCIYMYICTYVCVIQNLHFNLPMWGTIRLTRITSKQLEFHCNDNEVLVAAIQMDVKVTESV